MPIAASIWITAAIGLLVGIRFYLPAGAGGGGPGGRAPGCGILGGIGCYLPAGLAAALALGTLSAFRWIESRVPSLLYYEFMVRIDDARAPSESAMREWMVAHRLSMSKLSGRFRRG